MSNIVDLHPQSTESEDKSQRKELQVNSEVEVVRRRDNKFPMIKIKGTGYLHHLANEFLLFRYYHPSFIDEKFRPVTEVTIKNYADRIRYWLNICAQTGTSYLYADYTFLQYVLKVLRDDERLEEASIAQYLHAWRAFYQYLNVMGVEHQMHLPDHIKVKRVLSDAEQSGDFLNYTRRSNTVDIQQDPLVDNRRLRKLHSYASSVLTKEQVRSLLIELAKVDIVYAAMAKVQYDTLLRVSELINYFPYRTNRLNPNWRTYPELYRNGLKHQKFTFIGKGQIERQINVDIRTLEFVQNNYLLAKQPGSDNTLYKQRKSKYLKYLSSKDGKRSDFRHDSDVPWLTEEGRPVSVGMFQRAIRETAERLKKDFVIPDHIDVTPHSLRHTGASLRLIAYAEETGVDIHIDNLGDIHAFIQSLLGHANMNTSMLYIRTVQEKKFNHLAEVTIDRMEGEFEEELMKNADLKAGVEAIKSGRQKRMK